MTTALGSAGRTAGSPSPEAAASVRRMLMGVRLSQSIAVAASLGVPDLLANGARSVEEIADAVGADPASLYRLLRALAAADLLHEGDERSFSLTELGGSLRTGVPGSVRDQAILFGRPYVLQAWGNLEHAIRTGENAFAALHGEDVWAWRAREPAEESAFNRAMASMSAPVGPALASADNFAGATTVADIGGGSGTLLAAVLAAHPDLRGILFDQPAVVAEAGPVFEAAGVAGRVEALGGSFFEGVPTADVYLIKAIIHDWPGDESIRIVRSIRDAATPAARLLVVERILGGPNEDLDGKLMDLHMLVMPGGLERTLHEWRELLAAGGWTLVGTRPLLGGWNLIEGRIAA
jgi:O-methyltransferase domain/Dimerisation domain